MLQILPLLEIGERRLQHALLRFLRRPAKQRSVRCKWSHWKVKHVNMHSLHLCDVINSADYLVWKVKDLHHNMFNSTRRCCFKHNLFQYLKLGGFTPNRNYVFSRLICKFIFNIVLLEYIQQTPDEWLFQNGRAHNNIHWLKKNTKVPGSSQPWRQLTISLTGD